MVNKADEGGRNILELVELLQQVDEKQTNAKLNQYSMNNFYLGKHAGDSELRTWFHHYKTLEKNGIIGGR